MKKARSIFFSWLPLAIAVTGLCLLVHVAVQQNYRQSLNDPQIQMAEDGAAKLSAGGAPADVVARGEMIDMAQSLAPWIAVYDNTGMPLEANAFLDGAPPKPPKGVFDAAKSANPTHEDRISWQPSSDVRQAIVIVYVPQKDEYVVAGRNMREVEDREGQLGTFVLLAWLAIMGATLFAKILGHYCRARA